MLDVYFDREVEMMKTAQHENILRFTAWEKLEEPFGIIVTEFCPLGDLEKLIHAHKMDWGHPNFYMFSRI